MGWDYYIDRRGNDFAMNWDGITWIVRSWLHSKGTFENSKVNIEFNFFGPNLHNLEVDNDAVKTFKDDNTELILREVYDAALRSRNEAEEDIKAMLDETKELDHKVLEKQKAASRQTIQNITNSVDFGKAVLPWLKLVRDGSISILLVAATIETGGAFAGMTAEGVGILGGGSTLQGLATWEDTGNIKKGAADAVSTFALGALTAKFTPSNFSTMDKHTINLFWVPAQAVVKETAIAYIGGDDLKQGLSNGSIKGTGAFASTLLTGVPALGLETFLKSNPKTKSLVVPAKSAIKLGQKYLKDWIAKGVSDSEKNSQPKAPPKNKNQELLDSAFLPQIVLSEIAISDVRSGVRPNPYPIPLIAPWER